MARLYQKIDGEAVPLGGGGGGSVAIDNETITKNSDDEIQVATALTGKINQLDNVAADAGKVLTANGDGTAEWENGYVEGFYGTTAEWDALTYAQKQAWVQKNPKVTFTDDYVSNIKQDVAGCISSTNENDVVGASALKEALTYSTAGTETIVGYVLDGGTKRPIYRKYLDGRITSYSDSSNRRQFQALVLSDVDYVMNWSGRFSDSVLNGTFVGLYLQGMDSTSLTPQRVFTYAIDASNDLYLLMYTHKDYNATFCDYKVFIDYLKTTN